MRAPGLTQQFRPRLGGAGTTGGDAGTLVTAGGGADELGAGGGADETGAGGRAEELGADGGAAALGAGVVEAGGEVVAPRHQTATKLPAPPSVQRRV